jgi:hypothetical protein
MEGGDDKTGGEIFASNGMAVYACDRGSFSSAVSLRPRLELDSRWAGYGYEIGIMTRGKQTWATHCLSFMVPLPFSSGPTVAARAHTSEKVSCARHVCTRSEETALGCSEGMCRCLTTGVTVSRGVGVEGGDGRLQPAWSD